MNKSSYSTKEAYTLSTGSTYLYSPTRDRALTKKNIRAGWSATLTVVARSDKPLWSTLLRAPKAPCCLISSHFYRVACRVACPAISRNYALFLTLYPSLYHGFLSRSSGVTGRAISRTRRLRRRPPFLLSLSILRYRPTPSLVFALAVRGPSFRPNFWVSGWLANPVNNLTLQYHYTIQHSRFVY